MTQSNDQKFVLRALGELDEEEVKNLMPEGVTFSYDIASEKMLQLLQLARGFRDDSALNISFSQNVKVDRKLFTFLLANCISLDDAGTHNLIKLLQNMNQRQVDALIIIFLQEYAISSQLLPRLGKQYQTMNENKEKWEAVKRMSEFQPKNPSGMPIPVPQSIRAFLDRHVISQDRAKTLVSTILYQQALCYHVASAGAIGAFKRPEPVLLCGPTGSGKSFVVMKACQRFGLPFLSINTAGLVNEGIVGESLSGSLKRLYSNTDTDPLKAAYAVLFFDEFDKLMDNHYGHAVMAQFLKILDGDNVTLDSHRENKTTSHPNVHDTSNHLFIFGGSFQEVLDEKHKQGIGFSVHPPRNDAELTRDDLNRIIPFKELTARISTAVTLNPLSVEDLYSILRVSESSPVKDLEAFLNIFNHTISFSESALMTIAQAAFDLKFGARALKTILDAVTLDDMFEAPALKSRQYLINSAAVNRKLSRKIARAE